MSVECHKLSVYYPFCALFRSGGVLGIGVIKFAVGDPGMNVRVLGVHFDEQQVASFQPIRHKGARYCHQLHWHLLWPHVVQLAPALHMCLSHLNYSMASETPYPASGLHKSAAALFSQLSRVRKTLQRNSGMRCSSDDVTRLSCTPVAQGLRLLQRSFHRGQKCVPPQLPHSA